VDHLIKRSNEPVINSKLEQKVKTLRKQLKLKIRHHQRLIRPEVRVRHIKKGTKTVTIAVDHNDRMEKFRLLKEKLSVIKFG
jgi:hypothetical protein